MELVINLSMLNLESHWGKFYNDDLVSEGTVRTDLSNLDEVAHNCDTVVISGVVSYIKGLIDYKNWNVSEEGDYYLRISKKIEEATEQTSMLINIKKVCPDATLPTRGSKSAAGYDLYANLNKSVKIRPFQTLKIGTGVCVSLPEGTFGGVFARSGLSTKKGLRPGNCTGVVDSDYRGEIIVALHNDSLKTQVVQPQERIGQLIVLPYITPVFLEVNDLGDTERGAKGFGSTGAK